MSIFGQTLPIILEFFVRDVEKNAKSSQKNSRMKIALMSRMRYDRKLCMEINS